MEKIIEIDPFCDARWDKFVESHPFGWVAHLSGWKRVVEKCFPHVKGHCLALTEGREDIIKAGLPIYEFRSWLTGNRMVSIPFATLGDLLVNKPNEAEKLLDFAKDLSSRLGISSMEIRTLNSFSMVSNQGFLGNCFFKNHFLILDKDPAKLMKNFHYDRVRKKIYKIERGKLKLKLARDENDLKEFFRLYKEDRKRLGLPCQPFLLFKTIWSIFNPSNHVEVLLALLDGKTVGGLLNFKFKERVSAEAIGWNHDYTKDYPSHFLYWEAIKLAYGNGYKIFDFGRTSPKNPNLMDFKGRWGTKLADLPHFYYPADKFKNRESLENSTAYKLLRKMIRVSPDALQDAIGNFCYSHLC
jgi:serine/alanine adding enzyme